MRYLLDERLWRFFHVHLHPGHVLVIDALRAALATWRRFLVFGHLHSGHLLAGCLLL